MSASWTPVTTPASGQTTTITWLTGAKAAPATAASLCLAKSTAGASVQKQGSLAFSTVAATGKKAWTAITPLNPTSGDATTFTLTAGTGDTAGVATDKVKLVERSNSGCAAAGTWKAVTSNSGLKFDETLTGQKIWILCAQEAKGTDSVEQEGV